MSVLIQINGREAIPVRALPLLTNWRFMTPVIVAHVLGGTAGSTVSLFGDLESYRIDNGQILPIGMDWWVQSPLMELRALSKKIKASEPIDEVGNSEWQKQSLKELPVGVFIWKDDYQQLHDANWNSQFRMAYCALKGWNGEQSDEDVESQTRHDMARDLRRDDWVDDDPLKRDLRESIEVLKRWREPDFSPFMSVDRQRLVMEGFGFLFTEATAPALNNPTLTPVMAGVQTWTSERKDAARAMLNDLRGQGIKAFSARTAQKFGVSTARLREVLNDKPKKAPAKKANSVWDL